METTRTRSNTVFVPAALGVFVLINALLLAFGTLPMNREGLGIIVAAGITLAIYSFLYRDNPFYKIAEHLYVGISLGWHITLLYYNTIKPNLLEALFRPEPGEAIKYWLIVPAFLGILFFTRFSRRKAWLSRWAFAFVVGAGAGMAIPRVIKTNIFIQVSKAVTPFVYYDMYGHFDWALAGKIIAFIGLITVLVYFFFSIEHKGPLKAASRTGIAFLMISFGASFGYTVMGRISLLVERVTFLVREWLHLAG